MARVSLLEEDDELPVRRKPAVRSDAGVIELLEKMATIMHYRTDRGLKWYARAVGAQGGFSEADTAVEAMEAALEQLQKEKRR